MLIFLIQCLWMLLSFSHVKLSEISSYDFEIPDTDLFDSFIEAFKDSPFSDLCNFTSTSSSSPSESLSLITRCQLHLHQERKNLLRDLEAKCREQNPFLDFDEFDLRDFEIENWPDYGKSDKNWSVRNILEILSRFDILNFKWRERVLTISSNPNVYFNFDSMESVDIMAVLLERYKEETGQLHAKQIDWHFLYTKLIPAPYNNEVINRRTIRKQNIYTNMLIMNNIHFWKYLDTPTTSVMKQTPSNNPEKSLKSRTKAIKSFVSAQFLKIFRVQTGNTDSEVVIWNRLKKELLPLKFRNMKIDSVSVMNEKLYMRPEFVNNVQFETYSNNELKRKPNWHEASPKLPEELIPINEFLLNRFRDQSGDHHAEEINWDRIIRDRLPEDFKRCEINQETLFSKEMYLNPDLTMSLCFEPYSDWEMMILNRVLEVQNTRNEFINEEDDVESRRKRQKQDQESESMIQAPKKSKISQASLDIMAARKRILEIYKRQTGREDALATNFNHLVKEKLPEQFRSKINYAKDFFHYKLHKDEDVMKNLTFDVNIQPQLPRNTFGVSIQSPEGAKANEDSDDMEVVQVSVEAEKGAERVCVPSQNPECYFDEQVPVTSNEFISVLRRRFKEESGWADSDKISWKMVNRDMLPYELKDFDFEKDNHLLVKMQFREHPKLLNKIHFFRYNKVQLSKKRSSLDVRNSTKTGKASSSDIGSIEYADDMEVTDGENEHEVINDFAAEIVSFNTALTSHFFEVEQIENDQFFNVNKRNIQGRAKALQIFKKETGIKRAKVVIWKYLDKEKLPEPYKFIDINGDVFTRKKLFDVPEFMDNISFKAVFDLTEDRDDSEDDEIYEEDEIAKNPFAYFDESGQTLYTYEEVKRILFLRFTEETEWSKDKEIVWSQIIRERLPIEHQTARINYKWLHNPSIYCDMKLLNQIHFRSYTQKQLYRKQYYQRLASQQIVSDDISIEPDLKRLRGSTDEYIEDTADSLEESNEENLDKEPKLAVYFLKTKYN